MEFRFCFGVRFERFGTLLRTIHPLSVDLPFTIGLRQVGHGVAAALFLKLRSVNQSKHASVLAIGQVKMGDAPYDFGRFLRSIPPPHTSGTQVKTPDCYCFHIAFIHISASVQPIA